MSTATKQKPEQRIYPDPDGDGYSFHAYSSTTNETYHIEVQVYEHGTVAANCTCPGYYHRKQCWHSTLAIETVSGQAQVRALKEQFMQSRKDNNMATKTDSIIDQALAVAGETGLSTEVLSWDQFEPDGTEDVQPIHPVIKITQPTSKQKDAGRHGGDFWFSDTEEYASRIDGVALLQRETRALFSNDSETPLCSSSNGKAPSPNQVLWQDEGWKAHFGLREGMAAPQWCALCPLSQWGANNEKPACQNSYVVLIDRTPDADPSLAQLRISGKSIKPWLDFVGKKLAPRRLPLVSQLLTLTTKEFVGPQQKSYMLMVEGSLRTPEEAMKHNAMIAAQRGRFEQSVAEHEDWGGATPDHGWTDNAPQLDAPVAAGTEWKALNDLMVQYGLRKADIEPIIGEFSEAGLLDYLDARETNVGGVISAATARDDLPFE